MTLNELLEALASDCFRSLTNHGHQWSLSYQMPDGETGTMTNKTLDNLLADWIDKLSDEER